MEFRFSMNTCQFCVGHSHCEDCGENLAERLLANPAIQAVNLDMKERIMWVQTTLSEDDLEDFLEERSVFKL